MPPIRRYLRITQYSVLECRIYLDKPADAHRWLLNERSPVLPRVIEAVRPLVLPKLREENAKAKSGKGGKRKGWKDVVVEDDFEVAVFLTEISSRHAILHKEKRAMTEKPRLGSREPKLTGEGTRGVPVEIRETTEPLVLREESQEDKLLDMANIPTADQGGAQSTAAAASEEELYVSDSSDQAIEAMSTRQPRQRPEDAAVDQDPDADDKKKLAMRTSYDGFSIYGRILCLVVKRRGNAKGKDLAGGAGQAMMEEWIASTQMAEGQMLDE
ncbi:MAG: hypothetical protein LQ348_003154 [Seirophora lacunosa]|nr:MAG: hypothetical protein LQ344_006494 [Seirophora lacunosa]KAI4192455.1 MAG: hypothetical protein LQ348_003154 [Seirophora lacunosa]